MRVKDGDSYVLVGSQGGAPTHPAWVHNLRVNSDIEIRDEIVVRPMRVAEIKDEAERSRLWHLAIVMIRAAGTVVGDFFAGRNVLGLPLSTLMTGLLFVGLLLLWKESSNKSVAAKEPAL
jgi:F420H(2)-dependent quinone reductase/Repeat of Unknown Function (DUF347)